MVTISHQARIPIMMADGTIHGKERAVGADSFLSFLDKSLSKPLHVPQGSAKAGESASKPLQSNRRAAKEDVVPYKDNTVIQSEQAKETQPGTQPIEDVQEAGSGMKTETKAVDDAAEDIAEENQGQDPGDSKDYSSAMELTQKCDQLLAIMDQIIQVLQQAATPTNAPKEESGGTSPDISSKLTGEALIDELPKMLSDLVKAAEQLEGTKTAGHALAFAKKLQQLLGKDSFEGLIQEGLEITVSKSTIQDLAGKMLREAENTKMHLVQTSLQEIAIPAMKAEAPKAPSTAAISEGNEETTAQAPAQEDKAFIPENPANRTSSELAEDGMREKPRLAEVRSKETENPAALKQNTLADAALNLEEPHKETIIAGPVRMQSFSKADVTAQIVEKAESMIHEDKSEMVLQLKPESLGKISLKVIHERGEIIARFVAENEQVKAILEGNMQLLKDSLQKSGVMVQSLEVSVGQQGGEQQRNWNDRPNDGFAQRELKAPGDLQKNSVQPVYRYGGSAAGYYYAQTSEIDLTA